MIHFISVGYAVKLFHLWKSSTYTHRQVAGPDWSHLFHTLYINTFFPFLRSTDLLTRDGNEFHTCHWVRQDLNWNIKGYGSAVATLKCQHWPGFILSFRLPHTTLLRWGPSQGCPSISLHQRLYQAQAHFLHQQAALTLRSPLILVYTQVRRMVKRHPSGTLQHSEHHVSKHCSLQFWHGCSRVLWDNGFVPA